ncbi:serine hydrolase domain-containing protein [Alteriqipengyuania lutimaris]|uniref:Class C beta-lactamase-related serine hydrolase n=1 Tax=Alteriqipengyuania lutimaris TaxID=1538146 RepID=A0A395LNG8_9SPHN|nr:serine hydrolase [Alteriqipengyuania lutimaris]MBB3035006.1 CubicO group peptidase (beta-lactamase class C family) [Alteriqipengyuania lutimaris]RDS76180.1 class C beta-lactamase-related serine hydrolase [Alteriqipengyuania lutimaris]
MKAIIAAVSLVILPACTQPTSTAAAPEAGPTDRIETKGLDPALLEQTLDAAAELPQLNGMIVLRDGEPLVEETFNDGAPLDHAVNIKSASKSVLSALVGIAIERGVLEGTDQPILTELADQAPANPDPRFNRLTVGNLLSMQAGLERTSGSNYGAWVSSNNWVRDALSRPFVAEPGGRMLYSTGSSHLMSAMLTEASGRSTYDLAQEWLAEPLGIAIPAWSTDPQGIYFGGNDMRMSPRDLARFGELYRLGGEIAGQRIVPASWIEESWTARTTSPWSGEDYGYGWFISEAGGYDLYYGWGYGGQMVYILPALELTVVMTSDIDAERGSDHIGALRGLLEQRIIPAAERGE